MTTSARLGAATSNAATTPGTASSTNLARRERCFDIQTPSLRPRFEVTNFASGDGRHDSLGPLDLPLALHHARPLLFLPSVDHRGRYSHARPTHNLDRRYRRSRPANADHLITGHQMLRDPQSCLPHSGSRPTARPTPAPLSGWTISGSETAVPRGTQSVTCHTDGWRRQHPVAGHHIRTHLRLQRRSALARVQARLAAHSPPTRPVSSRRVGPDRRRRVRRGD
jgi:hypothetical protein